MKEVSSFLPGFHRAGFGRKPIPQHLKLLKHVREIDALSLAHLELLFGSFLPSWLVSFKTSEGKSSRKRSFTTILTFWAFLAQVLDHAGSCRRALSKVQALCVSKKLKPVSDCTAAYCRARAKLSAKLLIRVLRFVSLAVQRAAGDFDSTPGRLLVIDGTSFTLPDSSSNRAQYAYASGQKPGCGFPIMNALGLFDVHTGACLRLVKSNRLVHDSALAWRIIGSLRKGDILLADRAFCSYAFIHELQRRGVFVIMRLHQSRARTVDMRKGKRLGPADRLQTWIKPARSKKASLQRHTSLPDTLQVRVIERSITMRGRRPESLYFITTLLAPSTHSAESITAAYLRRWEVELFFDDIKTSQNMETLRCESPHMIARELLMHMIAYNLVRLLMVEAEKKRPAGQAGRLSFKGTLDRVTAWHGTLWGCQSPRESQSRRDKLLELIASDVVVDRPGRREPRVIKRRPKNYQLMTRPRHLLQQQPEAAKRSTHKAA